MAEGKSVSLGEVVDILTGNPFKSAEYVEGEDNPKLLRGDNIVQGALRWDNVKRWPKTKSEGLDRYVLRAGDVVLAMDRPWIEAGLKYACLSKHDLPAFLIQRVARMRGTDRLRTDFLRYLIGSKAFTSHVLGVQTGTAVPHISAGQIKSFEFDLPSLGDQKSIATYLEALDDKIELNRRMNETLEEMARALFRDWFVDFGPTRRQMEGATDPAAIMGHAFPPKKAATLAALFPAKLGEVGLPEGWAYSDVGTEFDVVMGQSPPGNTYNEAGEGLPFFQGRRDFGFRFPGRRVYCTDPKRVSGRDWTLLSVRAPVGDINRATEKCAIGRGVGAFLHKGGLHSLTYYTGLALRAELQSYDKDGTVFGSINQKQFKGLQVVVPDRDLTARFDEVAKPMDEKIRLNTDENQTLAALRDLLLPKLMSGEIRLKDAESVV